jgi:hypothetical protein
MNNKKSDPDGSLVYQALRLTIGTSDSDEIRKRAGGGWNRTGLSNRVLNIPRLTAGGTMNKRIPLTVTQHWLGHVNLETTAIFLSVSGDEEQDFASRAWNQCLIY